MSEAEVEAMVEEVIAETGANSKKEMGQVMKLLQEKAAGRADGKLLSKLVGSKLS
ncbi:MAG: GatB/YqeY domain-containing protein [Pseudomonadota bacterium]